MSEELKPCPFCGGKAREASTLNCGPVFCTDCGAMANVMVWNRRTSSGRAAMMEANYAVLKAVVKVVSIDAKSIGAPIWTLDRLQKLAEETLTAIVNLTEAEEKQ